MVLRDTLIDLAVRYGFQVLGAFVILIAASIAGRWAGRATEHWLAEKQFEPPIRTLAARLVWAVIMLLALVMALDRFGFQIAPLVAGIGVAGLGVSFALQGVLSNVMAGLTIVFTKPFRVGEYIEVASVHGEVTVISLFSTILTHPDRSRVVIPNRKIVGEILHNYGSLRQLHLALGVAYGVDAARAVALAREVVEANSRALKQPAAVIGIKALTDEGISIAVDPWVAVVDYISASAEIYQSLVERFRAERIELSVPGQLRLIGGAPQAA
jgi:small conductance mechanosensitive channel